MGHLMKGEILPNTTKNCIKRDVQFSFVALQYSCVVIPQVVCAAP